MKNSLKFALTAGVMMAAMISAASAAETLTLCTGDKTGVYYGVGQTIAAAADKNKLIIKVIETKGSWENMTLAAEGKMCQAAIVQGDAVLAFNREKGAEARSLRRAVALHREYVHAICNRQSDVSNLYDLKDDNQHPVAVGETGSGSWITWNNFISVNKEYEKVPRVYEGGQIAAGSVSSGSGGPACMLFVAGLRSSTMNKINDRYGDALKLVPATGAVFRNAKDEKGNPLYEMKDIPAGTYPNLQPSGWVYGTKAVEVPTQRAVLVVNPEAAGAANYSELMEAIGKSRSTILSNAGEK